MEDFDPVETFADENDSINNNVFEEIVQRSTIHHHLPSETTNHPEETSLLSERNQESQMSPQCQPLRVPGHYCTFGGKEMKMGKSFPIQNNETFDAVPQHAYEKHLPGMALIMRKLFTGGCSLSLADEILQIIQEMVPARLNG